MGTITLEIGIREDDTLVFTVLDLTNQPDNNIPEYTLSAQGFFTIDIEPADPIMGTPPMSLYWEFRRLVEATDTVMIGGETYTKGEIEVIRNYLNSRTDTNE